MSESRWDPGQTPPLDPPARRLVHAEYKPGDDGTPGALLTCDCGELTWLVVTGTTTDVTEAAFTCAGCLTVHWFHIGPLGKLRDLLAERQAHGG